MTVQELRNARNEVVMKFDRLKQPLRDKREQGQGLNETDWKMWDLIEQMMNEELAPIDHKLFLHNQV